MKVKSIGRKAITHFTKSCWIDSILESNKLTLEGENSIKAIQDSMVNSDQMWDPLLSQYALLGRYVWFTTEDNARTAVALTQEPTYGFTFYSDEIEARRWNDVKREIILKVGMEAKIYIELLELSALLCGDNSNKWWVTTHEVPLCHWQRHLDEWASSIEKVA